MFLVDEYQRIFFFFCFFGKLCVTFSNLRVGDIIHSLYLLEK